MSDELDGKFTVKTTERSILFDDKEVLCWREGIYRAENQPVAIFDFNGSSFMNDKNYDELSKDDLKVLIKAFELAVIDAEDHGL
jgi:hypothetical protein